MEFHKYVFQYDNSSLWEFARALYLNGLKQELVDDGVQFGAGAGGTTDASELTTGTLDDARLSANVVLQTTLNSTVSTKQDKIEFKEDGTAVAAPGGITSVNVTGSGVTTSVAGSELTVTITDTGGAGSATTDAGDLTTGTLDDARLSSNVVLQNELDTKQDKIQFKDETTNLGAAGDINSIAFTGSGVTASNIAGALTVNVPGGGGGSSDAGDLTTGTLDDARLSSNVVLKANLPFFNIKDYGAVGDGVTICTTAISNAINAAVAVGGGVVLMPPGTFLTDTITVPRRVSLYGSGVGATTVKLVANSANSSVINLNNCDESTVKEFTVDGNKTNQINPIDGVRISSDGVGVDTNSNYSLLVTKLYVRNNTRHGFYVAHPAWVFTVRENRIRDNDGWGIYNESTDSEFYDNTIAFNEQGGIYNFGANTRFIGGKVLWNGRANANSAGVYMRAHRSQYIGIEVQENYYHGIVMENSNNNLVDMVSDMNNTKRRAVAYQLDPATDTQDPVAVGYAIKMTNSDNNLIKLQITSASTSAEKFTQYGKYLDANCNGNTFLFNEQLAMFGPDTILCYAKNEFIHHHGTLIVSADADFSVTSDYNKYVITAATDTVDRIITLPDPNTVALKELIFVVRGPSGNAFGWKFNTTVGYVTATETDVLPNNSVVILKPFDIGAAGQWRMVSIWSPLVSGATNNLQFKDEGVNVGAAGEISSIDFVGAGVSATNVGSALTVTIDGGSGSTDASAITTGTLSNARLSNEVQTIIAGNTVTTTGKNKFNVDDPTNELGKYIVSTSGVSAVNASYNATHFIPVEPGSTYTVSFKHQLAFYDENKVYVSGSSAAITTKQITVPVTAFYLRCSVAVGSWNTFQVELGSAQTTWEAYTQQSEVSVVNSPRLELEMQQTSGPIDISIAPKLYIPRSRQISIYVENIHKYPQFHEGKTDITVTGGIARARATALTPASTGTYTVSVGVGDEKYTTKVTKSVSIIASDETKTTAVSIMNIGDSYTRRTPNFTNQLIASANTNLTWLGLRGVSRKDEGRSGWTMANYHTLNKTYYSPFMQPAGVYKYFGNTSFWIDANSVSPSSEATSYDSPKLLFNASTGYPLSPATNDVIYDNSVSKFFYWNGSAWIEISEATLSFGFDYGKYRSTWGIAAPNIVHILLGTNDFASVSETGFANTYTTFKSRMDTMIASIQTDVPTAKIIIGIPVSSGKQGTLTSERRKRALYLLNKSLVADYAGRESSLIYLADYHSCVDRVYGFTSTGQKPFNEYSGTETETYYTDFTHLSTDGFDQMGDLYMGIIQALR